jgi:hypothetical protein
MTTFFLPAFIKDVLVLGETFSLLQRESPALPNMKFFSDVFFIYGNFFPLLEPDLNPNPNLQQSTPAPLSAK